MKKTYTSLVIFALFMAFLCATAMAVNDPSLYRAQLPIISAESEPNSAELKVALAQVLSKLTNVQDIDKDPAWADSLKHAKDWMLSYQYIPANNGRPLTLEIDFDPSAISRLLKSKGQNIPTNNELPQRLLIWLAIENGEQQQLLGGGSSYAKIIDAEVQQKAININTEWPLLDLGDLKALSFTQAWNGDWPSIDTASKRYTHDSILLVHLSKGDGEQSLWTSEWTLKTGQQSVDWTFSANTGANALRGGISQLPTMTAQGTKTNVAAAAPQPPLPVSQVQVIVYGIGNLSAMDGLKNSLQQLAPVQDIEVVEVSPDEVILNINAAGGSTALQQAIAENVMTLVKTEATDANVNGDALIYQWAL